MRYYDISLTAQGATKPFKAWSSQTNGKFNPGALNVEFDIPVVTYGAPNGGQTITIEGISLQDLQQAQDFAGANLLMKAGMQQGLPLANPKQAGTIIAGRIFQSFGNWEGTEMTLDFVLYPSQFTLDSPGNIVLNWKAGTTLASALAQTLAVAYPSIKTTINISSQIVQSSDEVHRCSTLEQLASLIQSLTNGKFLGSTYAGVQITFQGGQILIYDSTYKPAAVQLSFLDFVGQPTWIAANTMQVKLIMRGDLQLGGQILMPKGLQSAPGIVQTSAASLPSSLKYQSTFSGPFVINALRHLGNFRSASGADWVTIANCVPA